MPVIEKTKEELRAELSPVLDDLIGYFNKFKKPSLELPLTFSERPGHSKGDIIKAGSLNYEHKGEKYSVEVHLDNDERVKAKRIIDEKGKEAIGLVEFYDPRIVDFPVVHLQVRGRLIEEDTTPTAVPKEETPPVETETEVPPVEPEKTEETPAVAEPPTPEAAKEVELGVTPPPELAEVPPPKMERTETKPVVENLKVGDRFRFNPDFYKNNSLNTLRQELRDLFFQDVTDPKPAKQNGKRNQKMEDAIFEVINSDGENIAIKRVTADGLSEDMSVVNSAEILSSLSKV